MSTVTKTKPKRLDLGSAGISMTPMEFDAIENVDDRFRYELIHRVLVVSRLPSIAEGDPNEELGRFLRNFQADHPNGHVLDKTLAERYLYSGTNRRRADRLIWIGLGRVPDLEKDVPTIAVEFVSKSKQDAVRDYQEKRVEYLELGVLEYWVIDRFRHTMTVFKKPPAEPVEQVLDAAALYRTPLLPGFELPLARLFALADSWTRKR